MEIFCKLDIYLKEKIFNYYYLYQLSKILRNSLYYKITDKEEDLTYCKFCNKILFYTACESVERTITGFGNGLVHMCKIKNCKWKSMIIRYRKPCIIKNIKI
jgi:hypothetical protein